MNIALVLSGGTGSRLGSEVPKQYLKVDGKMIIEYCLDVFDSFSGIDAVQIVAAKGWQGEITDIGIKKLRGFSYPGETRQLSIWNGLEDIRRYASDDDIVIIHDAARPCVTSELLESIIGAVSDHDGALPVLPMKDTVYMSSDGNRITSLLDRSQVYAGQAPESFRLGKYYEANKKLFPNDILKINGSTEPAVLAGMDIAIVEGDEGNFKITTAADLERFETIRANQL
jgi:2-C-methyl-D-erythritol 4-phosphate cytidylyltransferase